MEERITCKEIITFIAKFKLWDARLGNNLEGITFLGIDGEYISPNYFLLNNGDYLVNAWDEEAQDWKTIEEGNIHEW